MFKLPLTRRRFHYKGQDQRKQQATAEKNRIIEAIQTYANRRIADDPAETQQLLFAPIANELRYDVEIVRHAIGGGNNGVTFRVTDADRVALAPYKSV